MHDQGKSVVNDDRCYPDMIRVADRELGYQRFAPLRVRAVARRLFYAWLPWRLRTWLRRMV
jgi:hypothetical protein